MHNKITECEIEIMKQSGFCQSTIDEAECVLAHQKRGLLIIHAIEDAFRGVLLGNGTGLTEARGIDDGQDAADLCRLRLTDEKENWSRIPARKLATMIDSLQFSGTDGLKFHLPAFMIADLNGEIPDGCSSIIASLVLGALFFDLNQDQRAAVRMYLEHILAHPENNGHMEMENAALEFFAEEGS